MQQVRKGEELNEFKLRAFLKDQQLVLNKRSAWKVSQFSTGFSNLTYLIETEGKELVLRRPPNGAIKRGHDMAREFKVLSGLNRGFKKAPKVYTYTEDRTILGVPFYVMEKVDGIVIDLAEAKQRKISKAEFPIIANSWLDTLVELHDLDYEAVGLGDLGRPNGYVERQVRNWSKQYVSATTEEIPEAQKVMGWLHVNQPTQYDHSLIHNDYKYDNVVFENDGWEKINAILDWEMCTLGDPLMDLGAAIAYWTMRTDHPSILAIFPYPTAMEGNPSRLEIVERYVQKSGRTIPDLVFYYAFGLFKNAVIVQQIYYRYHKGLTTNEKFAQLNQVTRLFIEVAWQAIQKQRIENLF